MRLLLRDGTVLLPLGDNKQLARTKGDITLAHANGDATFENKEEVIRVRVRVPDKLALDLDHHEIVTVELTDHAWLPVIFEGSEFVYEVDGWHGGYLVGMDDDLRL